MSRTSRRRYLTSPLVAALTVSPGSRGSSAVSAFGVSEYCLQSPGVFCVSAGAARSLWSCPPTLTWHIVETGLTLELHAVARTFKELYAEISPKRRARLILGMAKMHRQFLDSVGGQTQSVTFDASEYLTDEATIVEYLRLVRLMAEPTASLAARADAVRARRRLSEARVSSKDPARQEHAGALRWASSDLLGRKYFAPQLSSNTHLATVPRSNVEIIGVAHEAGGLGIVPYSDAVHQMKQSGPSDNS